MFARRIIVTLVALGSPLPLAAQTHQHGTPADSIPLAAAAATVSTAARPALETRRIREPIRVDGALDEPAWARARVAAGFVQQIPDDGKPASQPTDVRVLYDADAIYVGARMHDSAPDSIVARLGRRGEPVPSDWFFVYLDSFDDRRTAFAFGVNAAGVQQDIRITEDTRRDAGWDAVWQARVRRDAEGWTAEMRIPLSQLRFRTDGGAPDAWGLNFYRRIERRQEESYWSAVPRQAGGFVSHFGTLTGMDELTRARSVEILPHLVSRLTRAPGDVENPFYRSTELMTSAGADLRVGLGSALTVSATFNPDFGQVEADPAVVNLSAFETFFTERRPFFTEGEEFFRLRYPTWPPAFYSRRIGRTPSGYPSGAAFADVPDATRILGALKLSGRLPGGLSVGALQAVTGQERATFVAADGTFGDALVEPVTSYSVARVSYDSRDGRRGLGAIATHAGRRHDPDGPALPDGSTTMGLDGHYRFGQDRYDVAAGVLASHVRGDSALIDAIQRAPGHYFQRPDAEHREYDPTRTALGGYSTHLRARKIAGAWTAGATLAATSPGFEIADLGFNPSLDQVQDHMWTRYRHVTPGRVLREWSVALERMSQHTFGRERLEQTGELSVDFRLLNYWGGSLWIMRHLDAWEPDALRGGPALRKPGRWMGSFGANSDPRRTVTAHAFLFWEVQDEGAGSVLSGNLNLSARPSSRVVLSVAPSLDVRSVGWQYLTARGSADAPLYIMGGLDRTTAAAAFRLDYTLQRDLSLQFYARPYLTAGRYHTLREVVDPRERRFDDRFRSWSVDDLIVSTGDDGRRRFGIDRTGNGEADLTIVDPSFNHRSLQTNAVLRWEFRPGSTVYAVWSHDRRAVDFEAFRLDRDLDRLVRAPGRNVFMIKAAYWLNP